MWGNTNIGKFMNQAKKVKESRPQKDINSLVLTLFSRFMPGFYLLESTLKNRIFAVITEELGENWFIAQLENTNNDLLFRAEIDSILRRKPKKYKLSPEKLLLESGLGLWVEFFNNRIYKLAKGRPIKIFPNLPNHIKRAHIYQRLLKVKDFRNLLVHSRVPLITDKSNLKYLDEIQSNYKMLLELLEWIGEKPVFSLAQFEQEAAEIRTFLNK